MPPPGSEWGVPGGPGGQVWQQPAEPYGHIRYTARPAGSGYSVAGIVCGALALFVCPIVLGAVGLVLSQKAKGRGEPLAGVARVVSLVGMIGGFVIGAWVYTRM